MERMTWKEKGSALLLGAAIAPFVLLAIYGAAIILGGVVWIVRNVPKEDLFACCFIVWLAWGMWYLSGPALKKGKVR